MKTRKVTLSKVLTSHFLFLSWIDLRNNKRILSNFSSSIVSIPISKNWFEKTSSLIRSGKASYKIDRRINVTRYNFKKRLILNLKTSIIENSFVLLLEPYFFHHLTDDKALIECSR